MKRLIGFVFASLLMLTASLSHAVPITFNISQTGYSGGATLTGSFTGNDLDFNGALNSFLGEISAYSISFSGNAIVGAFTHTFSDLGGLVYVLGTPFLGDDAILGTEGIASGPDFGPSGPFTYQSGLGPTGGIGGFVRDNFTGVADYTQSLVVVTQVPEPATLALMVLGLAGLGFSRTKKVK